VASRWRTGAAPGDVGALRRFALVGTFVTVVDVTLLLVLVEAAGWEVWAADAVAVLAATVLSWSLHGLVTFPDDPTRRWYRQPGPYVWTAVLALARAQVVELAQLNAGAFMPRVEDQRAMLRPLRLIQLPRPAQHHPEVAPVPRALRLEVHCLRGGEARCGEVVQLKAGGRHH